MFQKTSRGLYLNKIGSLPCKVGQVDRCRCSMEKASLWATYDLILESIEIRIGDVLLTGMKVPQWEKRV